MKEIQFEEKYDIDPITKCWNWNRHKNINGYGIVAIARTSKGAHVLSYERYKGNIPINMVVGHTCNNPSCVNPNHLELMTQKNNVRISKKAKLKIEEISEIRKLLKDKVSRYKIALQFQVSVRTIASIAQGTRWNDVR